MSQKRFTVRRVGADYQVEPQKLTSLDAEDMITAGAGMMLASWGLTRRDLAGALMMLGGTSLAWCGIKGRKPGRRLWRHTQQMLSCCRDEGPSYATEPDWEQQQPQDVVDEESMESFPASDAPAR